MRGETVVRESHCVDADGEIDEVVGTGIRGDLSAREFGLVADDGDRGMGRTPPEESETVPVMPPRVC